MRQGNIFRSREPVNKVDSSSGSFSSLESEGGVKEVPLRQEKKEKKRETHARWREARGSAGWVRSRSARERVFLRDCMGSWVCRAFFARAQKLVLPCTPWLAARFLVHRTGRGTEYGIAFLRMPCRAARRKRKRKKEKKSEKEGKKERETWCQSLGCIVWEIVKGKRSRKEVNRYYTRARSSHPNLISMLWRSYVITVPRKEFAPVVSFRWYHFPEFVSLSNLERSVSGVSLISETATSLVIINCMLKLHAIHKNTALQLL